MTTTIMLSVVADFEAAVQKTITEAGSAISRDFTAAVVIGVCGHVGGAAHLQLFVGHG